MEQATTSRRPRPTPRSSNRARLAGPVSIDVEDETLVRFTERYESEAAFGAHAESDHFERFEAAPPEYLAGEPTVTRFDVDSAADVEL